MRERLKIFEIFLNEFKYQNNKFEKISEYCKSFGIQITNRGVRKIINKWLKTG